MSHDSSSEVYSNGKTSRLLKLLFFIYKCAGILLTSIIGACRALWVPGQDLATPHLMRNCGKHILSLYAIRTSVSV